MSTSGVEWCAAQTADRIERVLEALGPLIHFLHQGQAWCGAGVPYTWSHENAKWSSLWDSVTCVDCLSVEGPRPL